MRIRPAVLVAATAAALLLTGCDTATQPDPPVASGETPSQTSGPPSPSPAAEATHVPSNPTPTGREIWCPEDLADTWLQLGFGDDATARDFEPHSVDNGTAPADPNAVICSVSLTHPDGTFSYTLSVLADMNHEGADATAEMVAEFAAERGLTEVNSTQTGAVLTLTDEAGGTEYVLFGPAARVTTTTYELFEPEELYLLVGTVETDGQ